MSDREPRTPVFVPAVVTWDPEIRYTNSGKAVLGLRCAVKKTKKQTDLEGPEYFTATCWEELAETACILAKGVNVGVYGTWEEDNVYVSKTGEQKSTRMFSAWRVYVDMEGQNISYEKTARVKPEPQPVVEVDDGEPF